MNMRTALCTFLLLMTALLPLKTSAQNILISDSAACRPNDTVTVSIEIDNSKQFISFQFDLLMPDNAAFIGYSLQLSNRSTNHMAIGNLVGNNIVRVLAYSPDNSAFLGTTGKVLSLKLAIGNIRGVFPLTLSNAIIGDSLSTNILTGIKNGPLSVFPLGVSDNQDLIRKFSINPNPVKENSRIEFSLKYASRMTISLCDGLGREICREGLGEFQEGNHIISLPPKIRSAIKTSAIYYLGLEANPKNSASKVVRIKIVKY